MRPIYKAMFITVVSAFMWLFASFVLGFAAVGAGYHSFEEMPILWQLLIIIPGFTMIFSIPIAIIIEIVRWIRNR